MPNSWAVLVGLCHVISILPLMLAGIVQSHLYAQCVFTLEEIRDSGHATWNQLYIQKWIYVREHGWDFVCVGAIPSSSPSFFLAPPFSLPLHRPHPSSLFLCLSLGGFVLTEAVCARHQLCCLEEERCAAESGRERERKTEGTAGKATGDGGRVEKWVMHHLPLDTLPS